MVEERGSTRKNGDGQGADSFVKYVFLLSILLIISFIFLGVYLYAFAPEEGRWQKINPLKLLIAFLISNLLAVPGIVQDFISRQINLVIQGNGKQAAIAIRRLRRILWLKDTRFDEIVWAFGNEPEQVHRDILSTRYRELTDEDIEDRLSHLMFN